ncbi:MAG: AmmeMemoRadiSam system radical SAM enzyme [Deltaproteobacteria bacterium]|nr:AmmeMemoRadiSam system radical SAM enzyme [Deltaproteobacteria bacterium]
MAYLARFHEALPDGRVRCTLCPRDCRLAPGQAGFCAVRENQGGQIVLLAYGRSTGFAADPIEKKPLNHFLPGSATLSFGTAGCNLGCRFCQNWDISKARLSQRASVAHTAAEVVQLAIAEGCRSVAFTYNDPVIWAEWAIDVAREARRRGLRTVLVTAGYVQPRAREELFADIDAANVDLKGFTERFYAKLTLSHLAPVLDTLAWLAREGRVWVEVTNLLVPGQNDGREETRSLSRWVRDNMGRDVPLHFTAFHPDYKLRDLPRTPVATVTGAREVALAEGLRFVYTGNVRDPGGQTTCCPACGRAVIVRDGYAIRVVGLDGGRCRGCGAVIPGVFDGATASDGARRVLGLR